LPIDFISDELRPSLLRRTAVCALSSAGLVSAWILLRAVNDGCWLYVNGPQYVVIIAIGIFAWLLLFLILNGWRRVVFIVMTMVICGLSPIDERNTISAASSMAARTLRSTAHTLERYRSTSQDETYPARLAIEIIDPSLTGRFYRFEYVPVLSNDGLKTSAFLLKARPLLYDCGCKSSITVDANGNFHITSEDREATANDPLIN
jgi:hypothetical protein